jgi:hypothetical protein
MSLNRFATIGAILPASDHKKTELAKETRQGVSNDES